MKQYYLILLASVVINLASAQHIDKRDYSKTISVKTQSGRSDVRNEMNDGRLKNVKTSFIQIPDDLNGRLYRLCKLWGYFKYFNQHKCTVKWDTLLNTTIKQVLLSTNNVDFNSSIMSMFNKVGNNSIVSMPGSQPDTNINFTNTWISDTVYSQNVRNFLNTFSLYICPDTSHCLIKYNDFLDPGYYSFIDFRNDQITMPLNYTNEADRLTAIFYYWNVINYFHPFKSLMDQSWDTTLYQFIPLIRQASTVRNFHITFLKMATKINDSHGFTDSFVLTNSFWGGSYLPSIYFTRIDTNCVVTKLQNIKTIHVGDILTSINGIGIHELEDSLFNFIPASTPAAFYRDFYYQMMVGPLSSGINCTFLDSTNNSYPITLTRTTFSSDWYDWETDSGDSSSYHITNCGYGYVDMGKLQSSEVNSMYALFQNVPAIIFDIRHHTQGTLWDLAPLLFPAPVISAEYFVPALTESPSGYYMPGWYYRRDDSSNLGNWSNANAYSGTIYILVNQEAQSSDEYTCQYLSYFPNSKVIGTQTSGADGNLSFVSLPDGLYSCFTSLGWYYADGYQQQRKGVKIDSIVSPTPAGLRIGRDEILEAAFHCSNGIDNSGIEKNPVSVYPNPFSDELNIECKGKKEKVNFEILNSLGQIVYQGNLSVTTKVNTVHLDPGIYLVKVKNYETFEFKKIIKKIIAYTSNKWTSIFI